MLQFDEIVFGPIRSRRLGSSLGINLLPAKGKFCNFDCVYCECGWNKDGLNDRHLPGVDDLRDALEAKLSKCIAEGTPIDSITFSGNGEPTLNPDFAKIVDVVIEKRDKYYPGAVVSVLSNATMLGDVNVAAALRKVDNAILKLDAPFREGVLAVNRPAGPWELETVLRNMESFEGKFVLQTMFLKWDEFDSSKHVAGWMDIVRRLKPREIMVYTLDRETPQKGLVKFSVEEMTELVRPLMEEGFKIQIKG